MTKYYKKLLQKIVTSFYIASFVFQPLLVAGLALPLSSTPVIAQDAVSVEAEQVSLSYSSSENEVTVSVADIVAHSLPVTIEYRVSEDEQLRGVQDTLTRNGKVVSGTIDLDSSCSGEECISVIPTTGEVFIGETEEPTTTFTYKDGMFWYTQGQTTVISGLETGKRYAYPENDSVAVTFSSLPEDIDASLYIRTVQLTPEEQEKLGALSDTAYDISTNLENGTFTYSLELPAPQTTEAIQVKYAQSPEELQTNATPLSVTSKNSETITIENLDHFTTFVVTTNAVSDCPGGIYTGGSCYADLPTAVADSNDGDVIEVRDGTYTLTSTLTVNKEISIIGESEAGVVINASATGSSWGIRVSANNVLLKNFTVVPPEVSGQTGTKFGGGFAIHVSNVPNLVTDLTIENITIENGNRTSFDLHGVNGAALSNLTARNNAYGNGLSLTGSTNVTVQNFTSSGNAWGGIALYNSGPTYLNRATSDVTIIGSAGSIGEVNAVYTQEEHSLSITNIDVQGFDFIVTNDAYRVGAADYTHYQPTLSEAFSFALGLHTIGIPNTSSLIQQLSTEDFYVTPGMEIARAVAAVGTGKNVVLNDGSFPAEMLSGSYADTITIHSLNDAASTTVEGLDLTGSTFNGLTIDALSFQGVTAGYGSASIRIGGDGSYEDLVVSNSSFDGDSVVDRRAVFINRGFAGLTFENNTFANYYDSPYPGGAYAVVFLEAQSTALGDGLVFQQNTLTDSSYLNFIDAYRWKNPQLTQNTVTADTGRLLVWSNGTESLETVSISNNTSTVTGGTGIGVYYTAGNTSIENNTISGAATCISLYGLENTTVTDNELSNCATRGLIFSDSVINPSTADISDNTFDTMSVGVENISSSFPLSICNNTFIAVTDRDLSNPGPFADCTLETPTNLGYNENNGDSFAVPHPDTELACGGITNINGISHHWTEVATDSANIKYQRQYQTPSNSNWSGNEVYANPYSNYRTFGGGSGSVGTYNSRVRAFIDFNQNNTLDADEPTSEWSPNSCPITYDPNYSETRTISGMKFNDIDGDTTKDEFEQGLEGWTIKATYATPAATIQVDSTQPAGTDTSVLPAGQYLFVVSGEWTNRNNAAEGQDAEYRTTDDWATHTDGTNADLLINNQFVSWGPYSDDHTYYYNFTQASDSAVNFSVFDGSGTTKNPGWYGDNNGTLTVQVFRVIDETTTASDGSYSLTVPTSISKVRVYELQQEGWYQTTPTAPNYHELTFEGYEDVPDVDFGNRRTAYLSDVTVCKLDQDEEPVSGWTVGLATAEGEDQTVPVDGGAINSRTLPAGDVIVFANGTYRYGNSQMIADAGFAYRTTNIPPYPSTPQWVSGDLLGTVGALEIKLNGANISWMPFAENHSYTYLAPGFAGGSIAAGNIYDSNHGDNVNNGNLRVRFETVYASGETDATGCFTFSDVPYGQYTPFEIMQPDWEFDSVSMDGTVYSTQPERLLVDETTEEVTYTNTFTGEEEEPEATPTPTPTPTPSPSPTVTPEPSPTPTPSATPTPTPQVLGTSTSSSSSSSSSSSGGGSVKAPVCSASVPVGAPNLTVTQTSPNTVSLSWTGVEPTTHYALFFTRNDGELYGASNIGKTTTYTVNNLAPGFTYDFQVLGVNDCAPGDRSNTASSAQITGGIVEGRPVGDGGQVLGVDTEEPTEEQSEESTNETSETETAGTVLGASEELCATSWFQYLPLIILLTLGVIVLILEIVVRANISRKLIPITILTILTLVLFYWLRDCNCTTASFNGLIDILCKWFWVVALFEVLLLRAIGYAFIDDAN